jgi:hypothetical protein
MKPYIEECVIDALFVDIDDRKGKNALRTRRRCGVKDRQVKAHQGIQRKEEIVWEERKRRIF